MFNIALFSSLCLPVVQIYADGYHHWSLRLHFQSFSNIQPEISSEKQVIK